MRFDRSCAWSRNWSVCTRLIRWSNTIRITQEKYFKVKTNQYGFRMRSRNDITKRLIIYDNQWNIIIANKNIRSSRFSCGKRVFGPLYSINVLNTNVVDGIEKKYAPRKPISPKFKRSNKPNRFYEYRTRHWRKRILAVNECNYNFKSKRVIPAVADIRLVFFVCNSSSSSK